jgi:hypothetical protein
MIREPVVAGQFYPANISTLTKQLTQFCPRSERKEAIGLLLPHAGYIYSGRVAGAVISQVKLKEIFVILGPNHTGMGEAFSLNMDEHWQTPLGKIEVNLELAQELLNNCSYLKRDTKAHSFEHSIEVELPFLQYAKGNSDFTIVPIIAGFGELEILKKIGRSISSVIKKLGILNKIQIIASSDMTHYEEAEIAKIKDNKVLDALLKLDVDLFWRIVKEEDVSMCGYIPTTIMLEAVCNLGAKNAELIKYENSGDTTGDYTSVVGYAGMIIA